MSLVLILAKILKMKKQIHTFIKDQINASIDAILVSFSGEYHHEATAARKIRKILGQLVKEKKIVKEGNWYRIADESDYKDVQGGLFK